MPATITAPLRLLCIREEWGIYCGALPIADTDALPARSANKIRQLIKSAPERPFLATDLTDIAHRAHLAGLDRLPISIYCPGKHKGAGWQHVTIRTA